MNCSLIGKQVRLTAVEPAQAASLGTEWNRDSEYMRLLDSEPSRLFSAAAIKPWTEKQAAEDPTQRVFFAIRTLHADELIGIATISGFRWSHRSGWLGIGIGRREFWGKGLGSDALEIVLCYAFSELNLRRVQLGVFEYNRRAVRTYEKAGFQIEGRYRKIYQRDGMRFDEPQMGILREHWLAQNTPGAAASA